jgi:hypothetical protein
LVLFTDDGLFGASPRQRHQTGYAAHTMRRRAVLDANYEFNFLKANLMVPAGCWFIQFMAGRP